MTDKLAEHLWKLQSRTDYTLTKKSFHGAQADAIRRDPQAHMDALVEAGVLEFGGCQREDFHYQSYWYHVAPPKPPQVLCKNCTKPIHQAGRFGWFHDDDHTSVCRLEATPKDQRD